MMQGHGRVQLFGFAAVFVAALAFEFVVRLNGRPALPAWPRVMVLALIGCGALTLTAGQLLEGRVPGLLVAGGLAGVAGAAGFLLLIAQATPRGPLRSELHPLFFRAAAAWLVVASLFALSGAANAIHGIFQLPDARAVTEVLLRGFVLNIMVGVALRAVPGHLAVPALSVRRQALTFAGLNAAMVLWVLGSGASFFDWSALLMRTSDALLGVTLLAFTWWSRIVHAFRMPGVHVPRYHALVPLAWLGAVAYGVALVVFSIVGGLPDRTFYQEGAVRHIFMLGLMAPLMLAFAHIVLARFGTGAIPHINVLTAAFVLVLVAWPMRVSPALFVDSPSPLGRMVIAASGMMVAAAFVLAAFVCVATARAIARAYRIRSAAAAVVH